MKKAMGTAAALLLLPAVSYAGISNEELLQRIEIMQKRIESQQSRINDLEGKLGEKVAKAVDEELSKSGGGSKVVLANEFIDQLKLKGDLRVRYEIRDKDNKTGSDSSRERFRSRFRLGGEWKNKAEDWKVGAGLATGGSGATSTNDTWSETSAFETGDIRLDYAYANHSMNNDISFTLGQHKNPFKTSWVLWDGDARFAGFTGQYAPKSGLFATIGGYNTKLVDDNNTAMLYAGQLGYNGKAGDMKFTLATGYHTYNSSMINDKANTSLGSVDPSQYELNIGDLYGDVSFPLGSVKMKMYGQVWQNFGADGDAGESQASTYNGKPEDADTGYVFGLEGKLDKFKLGYSYSVVEADSLYGYLADADFGDGLSDTNKKGHKVSLGYSMTKNWSTGFTWLTYETEEDNTSNSVDSVDIYQFDIKYKF